jgi:hypothetical protein
MDSTLEARDVYLPGFSPIHAEENRRWTQMNTDQIRIEPQSRREKMPENLKSCFIPKGFKEFSPGLADSERPTLGQTPC